MIRGRRGRRREQYDFGLSMQSVYHEFCPIYLEATKPLMWTGDAR